MTPGVISVAIALALTGAALVYAGSRHQRLTPAGGGRVALRVSGWAALLAALAMMLTWFGTATAIFAWCIFAMLAWSVVPLAAAWWRRPRGNAE